MTTRSDTTTNHRTTFREDTHMQHFEHRLADVGERQALNRSHRDAERVAQRSASTLRRRVGESLVRLGRRGRRRSH